MKTKNVNKGNTKNILINFFVKSMVTLLSIEIYRRIVSTPINADIYIGPESN